MRVVRPSIEIRGACPYCAFKFLLEAHDITGELHALRCIDCREKFVVEIVVAVSHRIDGIAGVSSDSVLDRLVFAHPGKAAAEIAGADDIPTEAQMAAENRLHELELVDISQAEIDAVGRDLDAAAERVNEPAPKRELTAAEIAELRDLIGEETERLESADSPPEFVDADPFRWCAECKTRHFCNNAKRCTRARPAPAYSGINTRSRPPPMSSLAKSAPESRANAGLKYGDRR